MRNWLVTFLIVITLAGHGLANGGACDEDAQSQNAMACCSHGVSHSASLTEDLCCEIVCGKVTWNSTWASLESVTQNPVSFAPIDWAPAHLSLASADSTIDLSVSALRNSLLRTRPPSIYLRNSTLLI
jgi:hypothetical protein